MFTYKPRSSNRLKFIRQKYTPSEPFGLIILKLFGVGIHLSRQISTVLPLPIHHLEPLSTTSLAAIMLCHTYKGFFPTWASINEQSAKYFALNTLWVREEGFWLSRHPCFARRAKLNAFKSLKPIPSSALGLHKLSHEVHANFHSLSFCPHQNWLTIELRSRQREFGSLKQLIVKVVVACATALIRISRPAFDRSLLFQPATFLPT